MHRLCVVGCSGAGKSTLARRLGALLCLPVVHSDRLYWQAGWQPSQWSEFEERLTQVVQGPAWVIDGNYATTLSLRLERADLVVWLDYPTWLCLFRVLKRILTSYGRSRPDMAEGCPEQLDWDFLRFVATFRRLERPKLVEALACWRGRLETMTWPGQTERWFRSLSSSTPARARPEPPPRPE